MHTRDLTETVWINFSGCVSAPASRKGRPVLPISSWVTLVTRVLLNLACVKISIKGAAKMALHTAVAACSQIMTRFGIWFKPKGVSLVLHVYISIFVARKNAAHQTIQFSVKILLVWVLELTLSGPTLSILKAISHFPVSKFLVNTSAACWSVGQWTKKVNGSLNTS